MRSPRSEGRRRRSAWTAAPAPGGRYGAKADVATGLGLLALVVAAEAHRLGSAWRRHGHGVILALTTAAACCLVGATVAGLLSARRRRGADSPAEHGGAGRRDRWRAGRFLRRMAPAPGGASLRQGGFLRRTAPVPGWASSRQLRELVVPAPPGNRIVLGAQHRRLLAAEANQSVLVVGPTQSGKTSGLAIPALQEWAGPVVATSVKSDLVRETIEGRRARGRVEVYDPTATTGLATSGWSPLSTARSWPGARRLASALCSMARADGGLEDAGFWYACAEKLLAPLLFAAGSAGSGMSDVVRWIDEEDMHEPLLALELAGVPDALRAARTSFGREERQRSSVFATAETIVAAFADPVVAASAEGGGLEPGAIVSGGEGTLYCCAPAREQERLRPVFVALLRQVLDAAFEHSARVGRPLDPPLLVVLDEAANIAPLADLDTIVSTAAGHGIQLLTVWQDFAQIESRYGRRWPTIVNNHRAKVLCPGSSDPLTLDHLSALIGDDEQEDGSTTIGDDGRWSRTETSSIRRLAPSASLRRLGGGEAVVVYGSLPPALVRLRPFYEGRKAVVRS